MTGGKVRQEEPVEPATVKLPMPYNPCDECGHRAWASAIVGTFTEPEWYFCGHHFKVHEAWLNEHALLITDFRDKILETTDGA